MIKTELKACCYECNYPDIEVHTFEVYSEHTDCIVYCAHAKVCKTYLESEEKQWNDYLELKQSV